MSTVTMCNRCLTYKPNKEILDNGSCKSCYDNYKELNRFTNNKLALQNHLRKDGLLDK